MIEELKKIGLTKNEAEVYLVLIENGMIPAREIIARTKLHRQLVYDALNSLIEKARVSFVNKNGKKYFKANPPEIFINFLENKKIEIEKDVLEFRKILPKLNSLTKISSEKQEASVYQGNKGIKSLLDDMLKQRDEILTIGASDVKAKSFDYHLKFNLPFFHKIREKNKIKYQILLSQELKKRANELNKLKYSQAKVLPKEFTSNSSTNIYGDKISILMWGEEPFGILIKSKDIADAQRKYFNQLWKIAKPVTTN